MKNRPTVMGSSGQFWMKYDFGWKEFESVRWFSTLGELVEEEGSVTWVTSGPLVDQEDIDEYDNSEEG